MLSPRLSEQWLITVALLLTGLASPAALACIDPKPETELEKIYCQIRAKGKGSGLPDYQAFRRNTPQTQALLLKRPARKLGIDLPDDNSNKRSSLLKKPVIQANENVEPKVPDTRTSAKAEPEKPARNDPPTTHFALAHCKLERELIRCNTDKYELQINRANRHLPAGALGANNKLLLPPRNHARFSGTSDHYYLSQTYVTYIEKMIAIGLADATMSFTKYVATFEDLKENGGDFSQRFAQMYELLKKERKSNAVKSRYNNNFPQSIEQCMGLSGNLIVCDNIKQNWIYRR